MYRCIHFLSLLRNNTQFDYVFKEKYIFIIIFVEKIIFSDSACDVLQSDTILQRVMKINWHQMCMIIFLQ